MDLIPIIPENFKLDGGACFGVVPKTVWSKHVPADEDNLVNISSRCLLVDTGQRKILIDTGMGNKQPERYFSYFNPFDRLGLQEALRQKGYSTHDITDVILTHLHFDHVGGAVQWSREGQNPEAVFPNATYYCSRAQWETAQNANPREKASFFVENYMILFEEGRLELIDKETTFCSGIRLEIKNGHTHGQIIPFISYKGRTVVFMADFIPSVLNIPLAYVPSFDVEPLKTMQEKEEFLKRALKEDYILFFQHDYYNECCTLEQTPKGIRAREVFTLSKV